MIPLGTECTLTRPWDLPVRVVVVGRTLEAEPKYDVLWGSESVVNVPSEWLEEYHE